jgi:NAD-dependent SIR2 family protein deacetylase
MTLLNSQLETAAELIREAYTVFLLAGAGLSAEVGIPTYWSENGSYGDETSKHGYTALQHANATLWMQDTGAQIAYFDDKRKELAALNFASSIYGVLLKVVQGKEYFCVTSNTDSGLYRAGFAPERLFEVHGSYRYSQCIMDPEHCVFTAANDGTIVCPVCSMPTRPNVLFFYDNAFNPKILHQQQDTFNAFTEKVSSKDKVAILELGVGGTVPRIRQLGNRLYRDIRTADYVHVNLESEPEFLFGQACSFENKERWLQMSAAEFINTL